MENYESLLILNPELEDGQIEEALKKAENYVTENGGEIATQQRWGRRRLAYEIAKQKKGYFALFRFTCPPGAIKEIERRYKLADAIIRFMTVKLTPEQAKQEIISPDTAEKEDESRSYYGSNQRDGDRYGFRGREEF